MIKINGLESYEKGLLEVEGVEIKGLNKQDPMDLSGKKREDWETYRSLGVSRSISKDMAYCQHKIYGVNVMSFGRIY